MSNAMNGGDYRVKVPPGSGAGKGCGDCCADCAAGAAACGGGVLGSGGGAVVRLRTIFFGLGGGGVDGCSVAAVSPSASAGAAACSAGAATGGLPLPLFATCLGSGGGGGGCSATGGTSCCCCAPLYNSFGTPCSRPGTPSGKTGSRLPGSFFLVSSQSSRSVGSKLLPKPLEQPASTPENAIRTAAAIRRCGRRMVDLSRFRSS